MFDNETNDAEQGFAGVTERRMWWASDPPVTRWERKNECTKRRGLHGLHKHTLESVRTWTKKRERDQVMTGWVREREREIIEKRGRFTPNNIHYNKIRWTTVEPESELLRFKKSVARRTPRSLLTVDFWICARRGVTSCIASRQLKVFN